MAHTTASCTIEKENVMSVPICLKHLQCIPTTSKGTLQSTDIMSTYPPPRRTRTSGSFTSVRIKHASSSMLEVRRMFVAGGRVQKKACMDGNLSNTGLYKHFMTGCPEYQTNGDLSHLKWMLVDSLNTSAELLQQAGHVGGAKCRCTECQKLKELEDKWICRSGTFYGQHGLNTRDEVKSRSRVNFKGS